MPLIVLPGNRHGFITRVANWCMHVNNGGRGNMARPRDSQSRQAVEPTAACPPPEAQPSRRTAVLCGRWPAACSSATYYAGLAGVFQYLLTAVRMQFQNASQQASRAKHSGRVQCRAFPTNGLPEHHSRIGILTSTPLLGSCTLNIGRQMNRRSGSWNVPAVPRLLRKVAPWAAARHRYRAGALRNTGSLHRRCRAMGRYWHL